MRSAVIYVKLVDEAVDCWRPVTADLLDDGTFRIAGPSEDTDVERWEFHLGDVVHCERRKLSGGPVLVAIRLAPS